MKAKSSTKTVFYCSECGNETAKWMGQCPACGAWNTLVEAPKEPKMSLGTRAKRIAQPKLISELDAEEELRFSTGIGEFDRVLGGGAVRGSLVLVGGAPGIGKSTLLLQLCGRISEQETILYVSGEESQRQLKMRAQRLGVDHGSIYVLAETDLNTVLATIDDLQPTVLIVDSIQTMYDAETASTPGSISQVRECTMRIMRSAKDSGYTAFVVGHINKEGSIAGPKVLEHMVDCVLYFEGDQSMSYRILRAAKNRFGSTNEIGVFEMEDSGLREVTNPSEMLLSGRPTNTPGTCVVGVMEGSRTVLAEVQALVTPSATAARAGTPTASTITAPCCCWPCWKSVPVFRCRAAMRTSTSSAVCGWTSRPRIWRSFWQSHRAIRICRSAAIWPPSVRSACPARSAP